MPVLPNGQTCLENIGLVHRHILMAKNDYQRVTNEYDVNHPNAKSDGDGRGRGVGGGHTHSTPDCRKAEYVGEHFTSPINYTEMITDRGGDCVDINGRPGLSYSGRKALLGINNYSREGIIYSAEYVNTKQNRDDGQFVVGVTQKTKIICA